MTPNKQEFDDFSVITGIGPVREKWLRETFNIHTYQELAGLTASQVELKLKEQGKIISRKNIESWIEQARELMPEDVVSEQVDEEPISKELVEKFNSSGRKNGWIPIASFLVYFQTHKKDQGRSDYQTLVHYMEEDREESWQGIEVQELSDWMLDQISDVVDLPVQEVSEEVEKPELANKVETPAQIKIEKVRIFQPATADEPVHQFNSRHPLSGELESNQAFRCVVDFALTGKNARRLAREGITCTARCYEYDNSNKTSDLLSETPLLNLEAGKLKYTFEIPEASLPSGNYRLWVMVTTMQTNRLIPDFLELPSLKVS